MGPAVEAPGTLGVRLDVPDLPDGDTRVGMPAIDPVAGS
jgi:hypothetical protein